MMKSDSALVVDLVKDPAVDRFRGSLTRSTTMIAVLLALCGKLRR